MKLTQFKPTLKNAALAAGGAIAGGLVARLNPSFSKAQGLACIGIGAIAGYAAGSLLGKTPTSKRLSDGKPNARMNKVPDIKPIGSWHRNKWAGDLELYDYRLWTSDKGRMGYYIEVNEGDVTKLFSVNKDMINAFSADPLDQTKIEFLFEMGAFEDPIYTIDNDLTYGKHKKNYEKWIKDGRQFTADGKPDPAYFQLKK